MRNNLSDAKNPLFKLWVLTALVWAGLSVSAFAPAYTNQVFLANLRSPKYVPPVNFLKNTDDLSFSIPHYIGSLLHDTEIGARLRVPYKCEEPTDTANNACWGTLRSLRRELRASVIEHEVDIDTSFGKVDNRASELGAQELIEQQYRAFGLWSDAAVLTKAGIAIELAFICMRGPLLALLLGWIALNVAQIASLRRATVRPTKDRL